MTPSVLYLLDTNLLVHFVRNSKVWERVRDSYQLFLAEPRPIISIVTHGELKSLAIQWHWEVRKLDQMKFCLEHFRKVSIDDADIVEAYAEIDSYSELIGHPMGKNDLWIAATATATGATLLTTDRDFDHLTPQFLARDWIDPNSP